MLKTDWKQNIILLIFTSIMFEILTVSTLVFVAVGLLLVFFKIKTTKNVRNILAIVVFVSYAFTYGKIIDPEVGLNFLVSILILKILERETVRDTYMIFFGLILLISAGSLFERTLTYAIFFTGSFLLLIRDFYSYLGQKWRLKDLGLTVIWVLPLTFILFFFAPRLSNPIPFQQKASTPGEIGYTPDVNISQIESLTGNQSPVFQVIVNRKLNPNNLYWRGNTLSFNDGWNWVQMTQDKDNGQPILGAKASENEIEQKFRMFSRADYFFALDVPSIITFGKEFFKLGSEKTLTQSRWEWVGRYTAISSWNIGIPDEEVKHHYLQSPLPKLQKQAIRDTFPGENLSEVVSSIRKHFQQNKFGYSLSPGRSGSFQEFMERKIGFCSHYASAVAIILRTKGIPSRLVSGFLGGSYNRFADFYLISQNDAHVWVEASVAGKWVKLDPTEWIAPERVQLGGEGFMAAVSTSGTFSKTSGFRIPGFLLDLKQWFGQWDFHFYQWLEQMDYHAQDAFFSRINFKRKWLFTVIPVIMGIFMISYFVYLATKKKTDLQSEYQELWQIFFKKMKKRGLILSSHSVYDSQEIVMRQNDPEIKVVWEDLIRGSFQGTSLPKDLYGRIKKL